LRWQVRDDVLRQDEAWVLLGWAILTTSALVVFGLLQYERRHKNRAAHPRVDAQG